jgi:hypothetical protein
MSKNMVANRVGASVMTVSDLTRLIEETLGLLSEHSSVLDEHDEQNTAPLPSLLAQCEILLEEAREDSATIRSIHSFGQVEQRFVQTLNAFANLVLVQGSPIFEFVGQNGSGLSQVKKTATRAAQQSLLEALNQKGLKLAVLVDALQQHLGDTELESTDVLVVVAHPLRSYLLARHRGEFPYARVSLEFYAQKYLEFLNHYSELPRIRTEQLKDSPELAVIEMATALDLPPPRDPQTLSEIVSDESISFPLHFADGSIAIDEPLDTPAYIKLCQTLGYDPANLAPESQQNVQPVRPALPARRQDRSASRVMHILPRIAEGLENAGPVLCLADFKLDTCALIECLEDCLGHPDGMPERLDSYLLELQPRDSALLLISCAAHFQACGQSIYAISLLSEARPFLRPEDRFLSLLAVELLLKMNQHDAALEVLTADGFSGPYALGASDQSELRKLIGQLASKKTAEHGHALLLSHLQAAPPQPSSRRRVMIEIGTTRESVPGQGSTEKLAMCCAEFGVEFITVDMDPRNSRNAQRMFRRKNLPFRAVTAKGEDFLASWTGWVDYCFLDAYDFDHGQHSDLRQSRYESFLGSRIDDIACHAMHYACAQSLIEKLTPDGLICFDDTWTDDDGAWTAKGTTAMPLLMENGFKVIEARNRAALLRRS